MYATCLHCNSPLGANESIEAMPIGRRLAFDGPRGRLWVICRVCERWNLTPFDERWEALEQCERAYRETRVRVSTDNIGMARMTDGTDLVRIGSPMRPEFAAWRYGDQFGRRMKRNALVVAGSVAGVGLAASGMAIAGASMLALWPVINAVGIGRLIQRNKKFSTLAAMTADGEWVTPMGTARLIDMPDTPERWGIATSISARGPTLASLQPRTWTERNQAGKNEIGSVQIPGALALPLLRRVMPTINTFGARTHRIQEGVQLIEAAGGPEHFARWATGKRREWAARSTFGDTGALTAIPVAARLAFEMAIHEDSERRALNGELATLAAAWHDAEALAHIADGLGLPASIDDKIEQFRLDNRPSPRE